MHRKYRNVYDHANRLPLMDCSNVTSKYFDSYHYRRNCGTPRTPAPCYWSTAASRYQTWILELESLQRDLLMQTKPIKGTKGISLLNLVY